MLELATLGLLQREPLHGYKLKQQLELFMSSCISVNFGSIYPLLTRLEEGGLITTLVAAEAESLKSARNCKIYEITEMGRHRWRQKMSENPQESWVHSRSRFLIKFFFFAHLEISERIQLLEYRLMVCKLRLEKFKAESIALDNYQRTTWDYGITVLQQEILWLIEQLNKELAQ